MIINEKLFKDLFLESHRKLAIQSLKSLNEVENMLIFEDNIDNKYNLYNIETYKYITSDYNGSIANMLFKDCKLQFSVNNESLITEIDFNSSFVIINNIFYRLLLRNLEFSNNTYTIKCSLI